MTELNQIYKCNVCGNIVEVVHTGGGELVCCGAPMELRQEKNEDEGMEEHVPVIEKTSSGVIVRVGSVAHPMTAEHHIEWIEIITADGKAGKKFLKPGDKPESEFQTRMNIAGARAYCNVHGLWEMKISQ